MATNSNSDQENIDNNELKVVETDDKTVMDLMRQAGYALAVTTFEVEPNQKELNTDSLEYQSLDDIAQQNKPNANPNASGNSSTGGGATVNFVDEKRVDHKMPEILENPAMEIKEGKLDDKKKEAIENKAKASKEKADQAIDERQ